jgi:hypothetical protein
VEPKIGFAVLDGDSGWADVAYQTREVIRYGLEGEDLRLTLDGCNETRIID